MDLSPSPATPGDGTLTREIAHADLLIRLFQIDSTIELLEECDRYLADERPAELLKYWRAQRAGLQKELNLGELLPA